MDKETTFAAKLRALRESKHLTVQELAEASGLSRMTVHRYETGERNPSWAAIQELAVALGVSTEDLRC